MDPAVSPPVISVRALRGGDPATPGYAECAQAVAAAARQWGFFSAAEHGIPAAVEAGMEAQMHSFFELPTAAKQAVGRTESNSRGYSATELTKQRQDWKELFDLGGDGVDGRSTFPTAELPGMQAACEAYYEECRRLSGDILAALCFAAGCAPGALDEAFSAAPGAGEEDRHTSFLRFNHYPVCSDPYRGDAGGEGADADTDTRPLGISRHTDAGAVTVLRQDTVPGLQVYTGTKQDNGDGEWARVDPVPGCMTINIGDMAQVWFNQRYKAAEHRVLASPEQRRFSAAFFYNPAYSTEVRPLPTTAGDDQDAPRYSAFTWGAFRSQRFAGDYGDRGREIQIEDFLFSGQ